MDGARVLIVEDTEEVAEMLVLFLGSRGFKVTIAPDGETALKLVREVLPNLIMLDVGLPDTDGYTLFSQFREIGRTRYIPVLFLTRRNKKSDKIAGLQLGADDYITKPFDLEELYLRVQNCVNRALRDHLSDPNTGLPTGPVTREELAKAKGKADRAALEFHLRHLGEFRDLYGALAVADVLRYTALLLNRQLNTLGSPDDFLGQLGEEAFVLLTAPEKIESLRKTVLDRFDHDATQHYSFGERHGDKVKVTGPLGQKRLVPVLRLEAVG
jgi:DNA-binding response OmpR family regulator